MVSISKVPSCTDMGAIDPVFARSRTKMKSASIEASTQASLLAGGQGIEFDQLSLVGSELDRSDPKSACLRSTLMPSSPTRTSTGPNVPTSLLVEQNPNQTGASGISPSGSNQKSKLNSSSNNSFHNKAKRLLNISPGTLKPSASTSCLFTASDDANLANQSAGQKTEESSSRTPVSVPTRASLTHEWKKLKTPNKCRECNLLVYFNGRECSFCGFVAHKKCVTVLVIKCSGQQLASLAIYNTYPHRNRDCSQMQVAESTGPAQQAVVKQGHSSTTCSVPLLRRVKTPQVQPIFGQPVGNVDCRQVIDFMRRFIYEIDQRGLTLKGIYRVSSIKSKVDRLCNYYDQNLSCLVDLSSFHPNIIANALKMYLRQLPEPLLTTELYNKFIYIAKKYSVTNVAQKEEQRQQHLRNQAPSLDVRKPLPQPSLILKQRKVCPLSTAAASSSFNSIERPQSVTTSSSRRNVVNNNPAYDPMLIVELKEILDLLPQVNKELVAIIMRHLRRVADMASENQMCAKNLSIIFGPTLLSADNKSLAIADNVHQARIVELMITWAEQIFPQYANYESSAEIDLYLPDSPIDRQPHETSNKSHRLSNADDKPSMKGVRSSIGNNRRQSSINYQQDKDLLQNQSSSSEPSAQTSKTRDDLRELRRQFFNSSPTNQDSNNNSNSKLNHNNYSSGGTNPPAASALPSAPPPLPLPLPSTIGDARNRAQLSDRTSKTTNIPPGNVPAIKVQSYYSNLTQPPDNIKR